MKRIIFSLILILISVATFADVIAEDLSGTELFDYIVDNYKTSSTLGYTNCRDVMYSEIDIQPGNILEGIYTGFSIVLNLENDPSTDAYNQGINCEHSWPQSQGAGEEPQRSDMHHLFPCKDNVNSSRGNSPFTEINDFEVTQWYLLSDQTETIPITDIDLWSEKKNGGTGYFEPRESKKGDLARAVFYFYTMYNGVANDNFFEIQKVDLLRWNFYDPVSVEELARTNAIAEYQEFPNPYALDPTLVNRIWFEDFMVQGQIIFDQKEINFITDDDFASEKPFNLTSCYNEVLEVESVEFDNPGSFDVLTLDLPITMSRFEEMEFIVTLNTRSIAIDTLRITTNFGVFKMAVNYEDDYFTSVEENILPILKLKAWPNPFISSSNQRNDALTISYNIPQNQNTEITIYNVRGEKINEFRNLRDSEGEVFWNGSDLSGKKVSSGVYLCQLISGRNSLSKKIILMR